MFLSFFFPFNIFVLVLHLEFNSKLLLGVILNDEIKCFDACTFDSIYCIQVCAQQPTTAGCNGRNIVKPAPGFILFLRMFLCWIRVRGLAPGGHALKHSW